MSEPRVAVGAIAFDDDGRVLLIRRGAPPGLGLWTLPGGKLGLGEGLEEACAREVAEETGLVAEVRDLVAVVERVIRDDAGEIEYHYVIHDYRVRIRGGAPAPGDDAAEARWVAWDELDSMPLTDGLLEILDKARRGG